MLHLDTHVLALAYICTSRPRAFFDFFSFLSMFFLGTGLGHFLVETKAGWIVIPNCNLDTTEKESLLKKRHNA